MKKVLILGAGMVVRPIVRYLLEKNYSVTLADQIIMKAERVIDGHPNGQAISFDINDTASLDQLVMNHDLTVSLLPFIFHVKVAKVCIKHKKNMVTTSYVKPEMKELDAEARKAGILILNELGVDPGMDHMSAMRIIDQVHDRGGQIEEFYSFAGALVAPEVEKNPFNYKFTWAPKGVIMAANNDGHYLLKGREVIVTPEDLFRNPCYVEFPGVGKLEVYPNRDSYPYIELYRIPETKTIYRGTFRYEGWCDSMNAVKSLNLLSQEEVDVKGLSFKDFLSGYTGFPNGNLKEHIANQLNVDPNSREIKALDFANMFSDRMIKKEKTTPFDILTDNMICKMMIEKNERDMMVMQHTFVVSYGGKKEVVRSRMLEFGTLATDTSVARTVSLPAACGVNMILSGQISITGVHIPVIKEIYDPIMNELEELGIKMEEQHGLPLTENISC